MPDARDLPVMTLAPEQLDAIAALKRGEDPCLVIIEDGPALREGDPPPTYRSFEDLL